MLNTLLPRLILAADRAYNRHTSFPRGRGAGAKLLRFGIERWGFVPPLIRCKSQAVFEYTPEIAFDMVARELIETGTFEPSETERIHACLSEGAVFVDVGANFGYFSILASRWIGTRGTVFAFEPVEATYGLLQRNIARNHADNVVAVNLACLSHSGRLRMTRTVDSGKCHLDTESTSEGQVVTLTTLDDFFATRDLDRIDCLKIDAEGADFEVLKGARGILETFRPTILVELDHLARFGGSRSDVLAYLSRVGYAASDLSCDHSNDLVCVPVNSSGIDRHVSARS